MRAHGTYARYRFGPSGGDWRNGCRCFECSDAQARYERSRIARKARGWEPYVDAAPAAEHLDWLLSRNVGLRTVAEATGVSRSALQKLRDRTVRRCRRETLKRILAMHVGRGSRRAVVPSAPTKALIDEMVAQGMPKTRIAQALGCGLSIQFGRGATVTKEKADAVAALHARVMAPVHAARQANADRKRAERRRSAA